MINHYDKIEDPGSTTNSDPGSQPQLPLAGEVDLESIRREYEAKQLWIDARELAARNGYDHQERENLTQELALEGLQYSRRYKITQEGEGRALRTYVVEMMKMKLPRFIDKIERSRLPFSVSRADHQLLVQLTREHTDRNQARDAWVESGAGRTSHGFDFLHTDVIDWDFESNAVTPILQEPELDKHFFDQVLEGEQLELWSALLDDEDKGRHGLGKESILATYTMHRANPELSDVKLGEVMGHSDKWVRRRLDRAVLAIADFYKIKLEW